MDNNETYELFHDIVILCDFKSFPVQLQDRMLKWIQEYNESMGWADANS